MSASTGLPVVVIGAGPVGMAAAAQFAARGLDFVVIEAGASVAASVRQWTHVRLFSPWRLVTDPTARALLEGTGWAAPDPERLPTGGELVDFYLTPLAKHPAIAPHLRFGAAVTDVVRQGFDKVRTAGREDAPFLLRLSDGTEFLASAVIDASGTWLSHNPLGGNGITAHGESNARQDGRIFDGMPDVLTRQRAHFAGKIVAVVGAGHSATGTLLALAELAATEPDTSVQWLLRAPNATRAFGDGDADALPARAAIGARVKALLNAGTVTLHTAFVVAGITAHGVLSADGRQVDADVIVNATGARPDYSAASELRLDLDPILGSTRALAPLIDPNQHSCGTVPPHGVDELTHPEPGFYVVGAKSYGRAPTFLLATGYEQARSVVAALAGDWAAARDVRLELLRTAVCSTGAGLDESESDGGSACGTAPPAEVETNRSLDTGVSGGLRTLPLIEVGAMAADSPGRPVR